MKVRVHRNLHRGNWVITVGGKVAGYCDHCVLSDVSYHMAQSTKDRNFNRPGKPPKRSVHLWAQGVLRAVVGYEPKNLDYVGDECHVVDGLVNRRKVRYNPFEHDGFVYADTGEAWEGSPYATFTLDGEMISGE